jgi:hypothetical protein
MRRVKFVVLVALAAMGLALLGCSPPTPEPGTTRLPAPTNTPSPVPTPTPIPQPLELTVLHTNDTLGFTEPCG